MAELWKDICQAVAQHTLHLYMSLHGVLGQYGEKMCQFQATTSMQYGTDQAQSIWLLNYRSSDHFYLFYAGHSSLLPTGLHHSSTWCPFLILVMSSCLVVMWLFMCAQATCMAPSKQLGPLKHHLVLLLHTGDPKMHYMVAITGKVKIIEAFHASMVWTTIIVILLAIVLLWLIETMIRCIAYNEKSAALKLKLSWCPCWLKEQSDCFQQEQQQQQQNTNFSEDGDWLLTIDGTGSGDNCFQSPWGLSLDPQGNIHVAAGGSNTVKVFTLEGTYLRSYGDVKDPSGVHCSSSWRRLQLCQWIWWRLLLHLWSQRTEDPHSGEPEQTM